ncbi:unnamed protein product [Pocillopora meandrina]|uniref:Uncharacterized protein n=1 Tax=Pocillopora meandrina TaxID=46732 RepID=A0AAU9XZC9_9CNID|nr:unnamed protein product [Pocillopora meandrina]
MPWDMASDRTQRFHICKAKQVVDAALGETAPQDTEKLWISLVQSKVAAQQTSDEAIDFKLADALAECYKNAGHWGSRRQILSIIADKIDFKTLQNWLPGLTRYRFKIARHNRILHGRGSVVSTVSSRRMNVSPKQLDHFLDFITSAHIVQDLPFGEKTLKLSTKEEIAVPNVIRTLIPERIVQQYNAFCCESGFVPMTRSTLIAILNVCSASTRNSLQGLDYFTAQGAKAFEDLEGVVEEIGEKCGKGSLRVKEKKEQLKSAKRYLKDWAMKYLPRKFRESQTDWFAKRGIPWHIAVALRRGTDSQMEMMTFVHIFDSCNQDSRTVLAILNDVFHRLKGVMPQLQSVYLRQDNAGCYHCSLSIVTARQVAEVNGLRLARMDFSDAQGGKGPCKAATIKSHIAVYLNSGHDIETASQMLEAISSFDGVAGVQAMNCSPPTSPLRTSIKWEGVSFISNIQHDEECLRVWKAYKIGPGKLVPYSKFNCSYHLCPAQVTTLSK